MCSNQTPVHLKALKQINSKLDVGWNERSNVLVHSMYQLSLHVCCCRPLDTHIVQTLVEIINNGELLQAMMCHMNDMEWPHIHALENASYNNAKSAANAFMHLLRPNTEH